MDLQNNNNNNNFYRKGYTGIEGLGLGFKKRGKE